MEKEVKTPFTAKKSSLTSKLFLLLFAKEGLVSGEVSGLEPLTSACKQASTKLRLNPKHEGILDLNRDSPYSGVALTQPEANGPGEPLLGV